jgi:hypothetical protein
MWTFDTFFSFWFVGRWRLHSKVVTRELRVDGGRVQRNGGFGIPQTCALTWRHFKSVPPNLHDSVFSLLSSDLPSFTLIDASSRIFYYNNIIFESVGGFAFWSRLLLSRDLRLRSSNFHTVTGNDS